MNREQDLPNFAVAIIGGGFAGSTLAASLLRNSSGSLSVALIERGARVGRGVAYGTRCEQHLLNVPAKNMSAYPHDKEHFLRWVRLHYNSAVQPGSFLPRKLYGQYVDFVLEQEAASNPGQFDHVQDEAVSLTRLGDRIKILLRSGQSFLAGKVVLAIGNFPPGDPRLPGKTPHSQHYIPDPWTPGALSDINSDMNGDDGVLLIGSGLTSVDVAIALRAHGFGGTIHILSRRGLLPQQHKACAVWPPFWDENSPKTVLGLLRLIRKQVEHAEQLGSGWRAVVDSLRPFTPRIWSTLSHREQKRFLRHVRPYWEVHRHRVAPEIGVPIASEINSGQVETHSGRILSYVEDCTGVEVTYRERKTLQSKQLRVSRVVNCTGPETDCRRIDNRLLANLICQKMIRPDPLFLGLDTTDYGALIDASGQPSDFLYAVGPARKGSLWETTAVPEIRVQVADMAKLLISSYEEEDLKMDRRERLIDSHFAA